jgi:hypothetical protein
VSLWHRNPPSHLPPVQLSLKSFLYTQVLPPGPASMTPDQVQSLASDAASYSLLPGKRARRLLQKAAELEELARYAASPPRTARGVGSWSRQA